MELTSRSGSRARSKRSSSTIRACQPARAARTAAASPACARAVSTAAGRDASMRCATASASEPTSTSSTTSVRTEMRLGSFNAATSQVGELLTEGIAELLEELARGPRLLLVDLRHREADMDQHPVTRVDRILAREQADVD